MFCKSEITDLTNECCVVFVIAVCPHYFLLILVDLVPSIPCYIMFTSPAQLIFLAPPPHPQHKLDIGINIITQFKLFVCF